MRKERNEDGEIVNDQTIKYRFPITKVIFLGCTNTGKTTLMEYLEKGKYIKKNPMHCCTMQHKFVKFAPERYYYASGKVMYNILDTNG